MKQPSFSSCNPGIPAFPRNTQFPAGKPWKPSAIPDPLLQCSHHYPPLLSLLLRRTNQRRNPAEGVGNVLPFAENRIVRTNSRRSKSPLTSSNGRRNSSWIYSSAVWIHLLSPILLLYFLYIFYGVFGYENRSFNKVHNYVRGFFISENCRGGRRKESWFFSNEMFAVRVLVKYAWFVKYSKFIYDMYERYITIIENED